MRQTAPSGVAAPPGVSAHRPLLALVLLRNGVPVRPAGRLGDGFPVSKPMKSISRQSMDEVRLHAMDTYPDECCGVIVSLAGGSDLVVRVRNIQDEMHGKDPVSYPRTARTAYAGHPADLHAALSQAEQEGCALLAFYHSHPDHESYFSAEDGAQATPFGEPSYPEALQVVVSLYGHKVRDIKAFAWSPDAGAYVETPFEETDLS